MTTTYSPAAPLAGGVRSGALAPLASRALLAALFLVAGFGKVMAPAGTIAYITSAGLPVPVLAYVVALIIELGGGVLLLIGYRTRLAAAVLGAFCIISALVFHRALGDPNQLVNFLKNLAIAGGMLQVVLSGAGAFSIDHRVGRAA
jgi:putative oxidoreductase